MKIEEGKRYLTEGGDEVGPMMIWDKDVDHKFEAKGDDQGRFCFGGEVWRADGTSDYCPALVAEAVVSK